MPEDIDILSQMPKLSINLSHKPSRTKRKSKEIGKHHAKPSIKEFNIGGTMPKEFLQKLKNKPK